MQYAASLILILPLLGFLFNAFSGFFIKDKTVQKRLVSFIGPGVVLSAFVVALYVLTVQVLNAPEHRLLAPMIPGTTMEQPWISFGSFTVKFGLLLDPLSMLMVLIVTGVGGLIHVYATGYMADDPEQPRFFTYFNLFIFMMLLLVMGENFLLMFVGWEGVGSCSYLLISFWYTDVNNAKAGNKAFIVNRVGDLGFALGIMAVWSVFGTLSFYTQDHTGALDLAKNQVDVLHHPLTHLPTYSTSFLGLHIGSFSFITIICMLLFVGAVGKSAQIPLWVWLPDAMAGPTPVSALIHAATMVTAGVVMLARCSFLFVQSSQALQLVGWIGLATAFVGATVGLVQTDIKRVLAFSTVSQLGYMFLACGVGNFTGAMFHVTTHAFFKALLFLGSGAVIHSMLGEQDMRRMGGLKPKIYTTWAVMVVGTYAIAGFPLTSGFFSKDDILDSASRSPWGYGFVLYIVGLATAFMTAFYMNRLMWKTFYTEARFNDGELVAHHHTNFSDDEHSGDAHGSADAHDVHQNPQGEQTGHEEAGHAANTAHGTDAHGHGQGTGSVHTSPPSMMWPLYILAVPSLLFGFLFGPLTHGFENFLGSSVWSYAHPGNLNMLEEGPSILPGVYAGYIISSIIAIAGLLLARAIYSQHTRTGDWIPEATKEMWLRNRATPAAFLYDTFVAKWGFDAAYNAVFIKGGGWFAENILWKLVDKGIIDNIVNGVAGVVGVFSQGTRRLQTGYVRNYALAMLIGVVIVVGGLLVTYQKILAR